MTLVAWQNSDYWALLQTTQIESRHGLLFCHLTSSADDSNTYYHLRPTPQSTRNSNVESDRGLDQFSKGTCTQRGNLGCQEQSSLKAKKRGPAFPSTDKWSSWSYSSQAQAQAGDVISCKTGREDREEKQWMESSRGSKEENLRFSYSEPPGGIIFPSQMTPTQPLSFPQEAPNLTLILCFCTNTTDGPRWGFHSFPPTASP